MPQKIRTVGGVDVSYIGNAGIGAVTVLDYESLECLEAQIATCEVKMPYVPTLLSFREIAPALAVIKKLKLEPDVFLVEPKGGPILTDVGLQVTSAWRWGNQPLALRRAD